MGTATAPPVPAAIPTIGFNQNQNNASRTPALTSVGSNHGQVLSVLSHPLPSNPAMYLSMSSGHVLCVPAPLNNTPLGEGTFVPYNYNAVAHSESEVNSLSSLDDSILLSSSFDGTVCVWPNALSEIKMETFQVLAKNVDPNPYNIGVTTSLPLQMEASGDVGTFVLGDNRGRVELWMKTYSGDAVGERESAGLIEGGGYVDLTHMYERLHQVEGCRNVASVYPEDQGSITCLTLMSGSGDYFASANNYGEIRTWKIHGQGSGSRLKPRHVLERAHSCAIDNLKVLGSLVVTTGKFSVVKVWDLKDSESALNGPICAFSRIRGKEGRAAGGNMYPEWNQNRVVGLDCSKGNLITLSQDGVVIIRTFQNFRGGERKERIFKNVVERIKRAKRG